MKSSRLITIPQGASMQEAAGMISSERVGMLLVVDERRELVGLLSERDVICFVAMKGAGALRLPVSAGMSDPWLIATPEQSVTDVMQVMTKERVRHMPVMSDGNLIGVISVGDILKSRLAEKDPEATALLDHVGDPRIFFGLGATNRRRMARGKMPAPRNLCGMYRAAALPACRNIGPGRAHSTLEHSALTITEITMKVGLRRRSASLPPSAGWSAAPPAAIAAAFPEPMTRWRN
jgi:CBS domain